LPDPALAPEALSAIDHVLLSHDHHFDNLDRAGRALLPAAKSVLTTVEGAAHVLEVGPFHLAMTAEEGVGTAHAFAAAGLEARWRWTEPEKATQVA